MSLKSDEHTTTSRVVANKFSSCLNKTISTLLFSLFISDLESYLSMNLALVCRHYSLQTIWFYLRIHQDSIDGLAEFCKACKLNVNIDKTASYAHSG